MRRSITSREEMAHTVL